jgi:hypothetical protein
MVFSSLATKLVAMVSPCLASKPVVGFLVEPQNQGGGGFRGLGLKTSSFGLVIWASRSTRRLLIGLGLKTNVDGLGVVWPQNHSDGFHWFGLKIGGDGF